MALRLPRFRADECAHEQARADEHRHPTRGPHALPRAGAPSWVHPPLLVNPAMAVTWPGQCRPSLPVTDGGTRAAQAGNFDDPKLKSRLTLSRKATPGGVTELEGPAVTPPPARPPLARPARRGPGESAGLAAPRGRSGHGQCTAPTSEPQADSERDSGCLTE